MTQYRRIAQIIKTKGLKGEIVVISDSNLPLHFWEGVQLHIVPPEHKLPRTTKAMCAKQMESDTFLLKLRDIDDKSSAMMALGHYLLVRREDCIGLDQQAEDSVLGMEIEDLSNGLIGVVVEKREGSVQDIWVVEGSYGEVLIPAAEELIVSSTKQRIVMDLPSGLLELNR